MTTGLVMTPWSPSHLRYMSQVMFVIECVPPFVCTTVSHRSCALMCLCRCAFVENTRASDHSLNNTHCHRLHFLRELDREVQERHCPPNIRHSQLFAHVDSSTVLSSFSCISGWVPRTHVSCGIARSRICAGSTPPLVVFGAQRVFPTSIPVLYLFLTSSCNTSQHPKVTTPVL